MKITKVCVSLERKTFNTDTNHSDRLSISLTADVESQDDYKEVEELLYAECKTFLDKHEKPQNTTGTHESENTKTSSETQKQHDTQPNKTPEKLSTHAQQSTENPENDAQTAKALVEKYQVRDLRHLNYLRARNKISYEEWKTMRPLFN